MSLFLVSLYAGRTELMRLGLRHDRGTRLLRDIDSPNSGRADLHAVEAS